MFIPWLNNTRGRVHRAIAVLCFAAALPGFAANALLEDDYNQWKRALGTNRATGVEHITSLPGFKVELIRSAATNEGSWIAMVFDPKGRVVIAREDRGLLRMTLSSNGVSKVETINTNLLECRGLLFAHGALYANANNSKAFVRLKDTDGDDQFDEIKVLRHTGGGVGHGRNQLALGPDGFIYSIHGDDVRLPTNGVSATSPLRHYAEDRLLPCAWDKHLFNADASMPYGHVVRTDAEGATWEVMAGGLRNPFGIDFNPAGDLFTFDADMEWDVGLSWYHPTRVLHLVAGGDYGWRRGTGVLPTWSPDTLPSVADIGASSPTAIQFGTRSRWPEPWRSALFILDWSYGRIIAVHLEKTGTTYTGRSESFLKGRPLNVTDVEFGPDGAMYFVTGGRRTQSGLYRVTWTSSVSNPLPPPARQLPPEGAQGDVWKRLGDPDRWVRHAARVEMELRGTEEWAERALTEQNPKAALTALLALARARNHPSHPGLLDRLMHFSAQALDAEEQLLATRALAVTFIRSGPPDAESSRKLKEAWEPRFRSDDARVRQSLCELLVYLGSTNIAGMAVPLLSSAASQEEKFHYLFTLRLVTNGWSMPDRNIYFEWLHRARSEFIGANMLPTALNYIRADAEATLTPAHREALQPLLTEMDRGATPPSNPLPRAFVKEWIMTDLAEGRTGGMPDMARGKRLYNEIGCAQCHRFGAEGGLVGPDLTAVAARFDRRTIIESIIDPSAVVADVYRPVTITMKSGAIHDGRIISEDDRTVVLAINPVDPDQRRNLRKQEIAERRVSQLSPMPSGLLNTLTKDEVLDLIAWMESGGTPAGGP